MRPDYLMRPEGDKGTEGEPGFGSGDPHLGESTTHGEGEGTGKAGLDLDLGHLPWAASNIGENLRRSGTCQPDGTFVLGAGLLTGGVHVVIFEDLVETVLEGALEGVADRGGPEALPSTSDTLLSDNGSETGDKTLT